MKCVSTQARAIVDTTRLFQTKIFELLLDRNQSLMMCADRAPNDEICAKFIASRQNLGLLLCNEFQNSCSKKFTNTYTRGCSSWAFEKSSKNIKVDFISWLGFFAWPRSNTRFDHFTGTQPSPVEKSFTDLEKVLTDLPKSLVKIFPPSLLGCFLFLQRCT